MAKALAGDRMRAFCADTLALLTFFTVTGALNERYVAGLDWSEVASARLIGAPLMVMTARPYGLYRDLVASHHWTAEWSPTLRDILALVTFQVPIYAAILAVSGAELMDILRGCGGFALLMLVVGRPYGLYVDAIRRAFGVPPAGKVAPMTMAL